MDLDLGLQTFELPGEALRFNPADPGLLLRLEQLEQKLLDISTDDPISFDLEAKAVFDWVLGGYNDLDNALCGISLLAVAENGKTVLLNLLEALIPIFREGAERCAALV